MTPIPDFARRRAELTPDRLAFEELATGRRATFAEVDAATDRIAAVLRARGLVDGARVAVLCHNQARFFEILFAAARTGAILVPLNWRQTPAELIPILEDCGAGLLIHDAATAELAAALGPIERLSFADLEAAMAAAAPEAPAGTLPGWPALPGGPALPGWPADRVWYLLYTSGTTGRPKAVIQTAGMALANAVNIAQATQLRETDVTLNVLPLFHTAGINLHALPVFLWGAASLIMPRFDVDATVRLIADGRLTLFFGVPALYQAIALHPDFDRLDVSRLRHWGCGGAPLPEPLIRRFLDRGARVCNGMGMTETGPTVFLMDPERAPSKIGSVGKPQVLAEVRVVGPDGADLPDGSVGELLFRGPAVTPGYFGNAPATEAAFAPGGWLRSGDVGRRDADGYYYIVSRIKEMYISGGENVYPAEVEAVLDAHPAVLEAAVVGVPDARWGEVGHAVIRLRPGASLEAAALRAHARARLAAYKVPKYVTVVEDYPRTAAGKVQKHLLARSLNPEAAS